MRTVNVVSITTTTSMSAMSIVSMMHASAAVVAAGRTKGINIAVLNATTQGITRLATIIATTASAIIDHKDPHRLEESIWPVRIWRIRFPLPARRHNV